MSPSRREVLLQLAALAALPLPKLTFGSNATDPLDGTIADYQASSFVALAEIIGCDFSVYPNTRRWLARMKALKSWKQVNEVIDGYAATLKDQTFVAP